MSLSSANLKTRTKWEQVATSASTTHQYSAGNNFLVRIEGIGVGLSMRANRSPNANEGRAKSTQSEEGSTWPHNLGRCFYSTARLHIKQNGIIRSILVVSLLDKAVCRHCRHSVLKQGNQPRTMEGLTLSDLFVCYCTNNRSNKWPQILPHMSTHPPYRAFKILECRSLQHALRTCNPHRTSSLAELHSAAGFSPLGFSASSGVPHATMAPPWF